MKKEALYINLVRSLLLGLPFVGALLGYLPIRAQDGRMPLTDWVDPMIAGLTLTCILLVQLFVIVLWEKLGIGRLKNISVLGLIICQWAYTFGEILSNTITIGEPPNDIGSLFEIAAGGLLFVITIILYVQYDRQVKGTVTQGALVLPLIAIVLFIGVIWWFTHPIDQSNPGAPDFVEGNPIYNFFRPFLR
ncbi:hypothetical protein [Paenibacillus puerhi]|uniref:hypothetical protein n=1 Tax=Paenibacillus puerhi TaxID=2692622 RepID=UPI00135704F4|nr:hypothetical protein [Paenibacillus puerhi]